MHRRPTLGLAAILGACLLATGCSSMPVGNPSVPEPTKSVDLKRYAGVWYELGRYENRFETDCEGVTAEYRPHDDGKIEVINTCHKGAPGGPVTVSRGKAKVTGNAKLKVSFFGPFYFGNYWVLDHADDYSWSIVGEPSGKYLWLLTREPVPSDAVRKTVQTRAQALGYDFALVRLTEH